MPEALPAATPPLSTRIETEGCTNGIVQLTVGTLMHEENLQPDAVFPDLDVVALELGERSLRGILVVEGDNVLSRYHAAALVNLHELISRHK